MNRLAALQQFKSRFDFLAEGCEARVPNRNNLLQLGCWVYLIALLERVLMQDGVQIPDQVVLKDDLVCEEVWQKGEGCSVQSGQLGPKALVRVLVVVGCAGQVLFMLAQRRVLAIGATLFLLEGLGAALVSLVVNLWGAAVSNSDANWDAELPPSCPPASL